MTKTEKGVAIVAAALAITLGYAVCIGEPSVTGTMVDEGLTGTIVVSGSSTVQPITNLMAELFNEEIGPNVAITVDGPGTSDGFVLFCEGETDVQDASRPIAQEETDACAQNGVEWVELEVAFDGIVVLTNPANEAIGCLNLGDLYALMGPESEGFASWAAANALASEVDGTGGFPDVPLEITAPGEESGTYDAFIDLADFGGIGESRGLSEDDAEAMRKDYQASPDDNVILSAVEGTDSALGYVGFAFAEEGGEQLKELAVDGGDGCVAPSRQTIADGSYPLSRSLYIYVNTGRLREKPEVQAFVDYYLDAANLAEVVPAVGYVPLPADRIEATTSAWTTAKAAGA